MRGHAHLEAWNVTTLSHWREGLRVCVHEPKNNPPGRGVRSMSNSAALSLLVSLYNRHRTTAAWRRRLRRKSQDCGYLILSSSTSKVSVELGGITPG
jgi:hypothetical protein